MMIKFDVDATEADQFFVKLTDQVLGRVRGLTELFDYTLQDVGREVYAKLDNVMDDLEKVERERVDFLKPIHEASEEAIAKSEIMLKELNMTHDRVDRLIDVKEHEHPLPHHGIPQQVQLMLLSEPKGISNDAMKTWKRFGALTIERIKALSPTWAPVRFNEELTLYKEW